MRHCCNFDTYQISQRHRVVCLPQHGFLVGLCLQASVNYLSKSDKYQKEPVHQFSGELRKQFVRKSALRPFKIIQGHGFWYQSKVCMRLPISSSYFAPFHRYCALNHTLFHPNFGAGGKMRTADMRTGKGVKCGPNLPTLRTRSAFYPFMPALARSAVRISQYEMHGDQQHKDSVTGLENGVEKPRFFFYFFKSKFQVFWVLLFLSNFFHKIYIFNFTFQSKFVGFVTIYRK